MVGRGIVGVKWRIGVPGRCWCFRWDAIGRVRVVERLGSGSLFKSGTSFAGMTKEGLAYIMVCG